MEVPQTDDYLKGLHFSDRIYVVDALQNFHNIKDNTERLTAMATWLYDERNISILHKSIRFRQVFVNLLLEHAKGWKEERDGIANILDKIKAEMKGE